MNRTGPWMGYETVLTRRIPLRAMADSSMFLHGETMISLFLVKQFLKKNYAVRCPGIDAIPDPWLYNAIATGAP